MMRHKLAVLNPIITGAVLLAGFLCCRAASAAELKFAFVDPQRVFTESRIGKAGMAELEKAEKDSRAKLDKLRDQINDMETANRQQYFTMSEEARALKDEEVNRAKLELKRGAEDADYMLNKRQKEFLEKVDKEAMVIIQQLGKEKGYTMVFSKVGSSLLYADQSVDITDEVIKRYDAGQSGAGAPPAEKKPK